MLSVVGPDAAGQALGSPVPAPLRDGLAGTVLVGAGHHPLKGARLGSVVAEGAIIRAGVFLEGRVRKTR